MADALAGLYSSSTLCPDADHHLCHLDYLAAHLEELKRGSPGAGGNAGPLASFPVMALTAEGGQDGAEGGVYWPLSKGKPLRLPLPLRELQQEFQSGGLRFLHPVGDWNAHLLLLPPCM